MTPPKGGCRGGFSRAHGHARGAPGQGSARSPFTQPGVDTATATSTLARSSPTTPSGGGSVPRRPTCLLALLGGQGSLGPRHHDAGVRASQELFPGSSPLGHPQRSLHYWMEAGAQLDQAGSISVSLSSWNWKEAGRHGLIQAPQRPSHISGSARSPGPVLLAGSHSSKRPGSGPFAAQLLHLVWEQGPSRGPK